MKEAMQQVKDDLGADAVILHTKKYREGGILGFNAKEVVEVTAAIEDTPEPPKKKAGKPSKKASRIDVSSEPEALPIPPVTTAQRSQGLRTYGQYGRIPGRRRRKNGKPHKRVLMRWCKASHKAIRRQPSRSKMRQGARRLQPRPAVKMACRRRQDCRRQETQRR